MLRLITLITCLWLNPLFGFGFAGSMADALNDAKVTAPKTGKRKPSNGRKPPTDAADAALKAAPKTWAEALDNVLLEVPKSVKKAVSDTTQYLMKSLQSDAHNQISRGEQLAALQDKVSEATFARLINEVWSRFGASKASVYRWIKNFTVLSVAVPYGVARDALVTVTSGNNLFVTKDGSTTLTGPYTLGLKKHPVPIKGTSYEDCLDWAREVQIVAEKADKDSGQTISDVYKSGLNKLRVLLEGNRKFNANLKFATEFVVAAFRELHTKSAPLGMAAFEACEQITNGETVHLDVIGKSAMDALKAAQETGDEIKKIA